MYILGHFKNRATIIKINENTETIDWYVGLSNEK